MDYNTKTFLVTGGAGLVGSHIVDELVKKNAGKIVIIDNFTRGQMKNLKWAENNGNLKIIDDDILNYKLLKELMIGVDTVFHQV